MILRILGRIFPYPLLSLALMVMWLLLTSSVATKSIVFGALVGLFVPFALKRLDPPKAKIRNPWAIIRLTGIVLQDIVRSNVAVMLLILGQKRKERVSGFIHVPLDIRDDYALAVLAIILTCTPGTLWVQYDSSRRRLLLHVLDLVDEQEWIDLIKNRYERLLMEIYK